MSGTSYGFIQRQKNKERREALSQKMFDFGDLLENGPKGFYHDVTTLPHPKQEILGGFLNAIANAESKAEVEIYAASAIYLSNYLDGVGEKTFTPFSTNGVDLDAAFPDQLRDFIAATDIPKIQALNTASAHDLKFIASCTDAARAMNPHLRSPLKKAWEKFRQRGFYSPFSDGFVDASFEILHL